MAQDINLDEVYASEWLTVDQFPADGMTVSIAEVEQGTNLDQKPVVILRLVGTKPDGTQLDGKRNLTRKQAKALSKMYGGTSQWGGKEIFARPEELNNGMTTLAFFRPLTPQPAPQPGAAATPPEPEGPPMGIYGTAPPSA